MRHIKKLAVWLLGLIFGLLSSGLLMYSFDDTLHRIDSTTVPDTPTAYLLGGFMGSFFGVIFNVVAFAVFLILILALKREIQFRNFIIKGRTKIAQKSIQLIGYGIIVAFIYSYCKDLLIYKEFVLSEFLFYISAIAAAAFYIVILASIAGPKSETT